MSEFRGILKDKEPIFHILLILNLKSSILCLKHCSLEELTTVGGTQSVHLCMCLTVKNWTSCYLSPLILLFVVVERPKPYITFQSSVLTYSLSCLNSGLNISNFFSSSHHLSSVHWQQLNSPSFEYFQAPCSCYSSSSLLFTINWTYLVLFIMPNLFYLLSHLIFIIWGVEIYLHTSSELAERELNMHLQ
jgi:hypothetical protein